MTKPLRDAIEALIESLDTNAFGRMVAFSRKLSALKKAYQEQQNAMTETAKRVEFLQDWLEKGVSKRKAARLLVAHDPRIGQKTAETLVYINFSGQYVTTMRGCRKGKQAEIPVTAPVESPPDIEDDEAIL